ncbi:WXG100 family type VII secretion target [Actinophytocola oryzae]|uniref:Excreted virulence factor EspC (Type VII ESX diderm) n=1 Tax=Actinophytocola oryzae TaxID=502181 RepID=A0A4R7USY6_9PSEU|nr:hypothetical protein [Actinophytocola oryzae]TDV36862.1 hypothetical protein CLV71_13068 [Actinophytocola oryzae]
MHADAYEADGYEVDAETLATRATQFEPLSGRLTKIHQTLADALSTGGACWGGDAVGQSFASVHTGPADDALTRLSGLPGRLTTVSTRLTDTANTYRAGEDSATEHVKAAEQ